MFSELRLIQEKNSELSEQTQQFQDEMEKHQREHRKQMDVSGFPCIVLDSRVSRLHLDALTLFVIFIFY